MSVFQFPLASNARLSLSTVILPSTPSPTAGVSAHQPTLASRYVIHSRLHRFLLLQLTLVSAPVLAALPIFLQGLHQQVLYGDNRSQRRIQGVEAQGYDHSSCRFSSYGGRRRRGCFPARLYPSARKPLAGTVMTDDAHINSSLSAFRAQLIGRLSQRRALCSACYVHHQRLIADPRP